MGGYGGVEPSASQLPVVQQVVMRNIPYAVWAVILLAVGLLDILSSFRPIGTFGVSLLTVIAYAYRHIIERYVRVIKVSRKFLLVSVIAIATNLVIGISLNAVMRIRARDLALRVEEYKSRYGVFPKSLLDIADDSERDNFRKNRMLLGAHVTYVSDGSKFYLSYDSYPAGGWMWDEADKHFEAELD